MRHTTRSLASTPRSSASTRRACGISSSRLPLKVFFEGMSAERRSTPRHGGESCLVGRSRRPSHEDRATSLLAGLSGLRTLLRTRLLAAVMWLHRYVNRNAVVLGLPQVSAARKDLNRCRQLLAGISEPRTLAFLADPVVAQRTPLPMRWEGYEPALRLALSILRQEAVIVERGGRRLELPTLLVNMEDLFEQYIRVVLQRTAVREGWIERVLDAAKGPPTGARGRVFEDKGDDAVDTEPDITCVRPGAPAGQKHPVILEIKYKAMAKRPEREHLNQLLTYGLAYQTTQLVLVQPVGSLPVPSGLRRVGKVRGMTVYAYAVNLGNDLDAEETFSALPFAIFAPSLLDSM